MAEKTAKAKDDISRGKKEKTPVEKAKSITDKVKKKPVAPMDNEEKVFKESFEAPMEKRIKEGKFNPQGSQGRKSWDAPDKTVYEKPAGKAGPLPRSPESIGLPKIPKAPNAGGAARPNLPPIPKAPSKPNLPPIPKAPSKPNLPPIPKAPSKPLVPPPPAAVAGSANVVPRTDPLAKFRPSNAGDMTGAITGGPGAAAWDYAWGPQTPMYQQDAMEAEYEPRRAQNAERGDWFAGQIIDQLKGNIDQMAATQGRPELRKINAAEWHKRLQQGRK